MESVDTFIKSLKELDRIDKNSSAAEFSIDTTKLDSVTKGKLLDAIRGVISQRKKDINRVITRIDN